MVIENENIDDLEAKAKELNFEVKATTPLKKNDFNINGLGSGQTQEISSNGLMKMVMMSVILHLQFIPLIIKNIIIVKNM
ncbi:MAG: hypothetical protein R2771_01505 [Saprospiraceae bacterium]